VSHTVRDAPFAVDARPDRSRVIVSVTGEIDRATIGAVTRALDELRAAGWADLVLDLHNVTFMDSSGLALMLDCDRAAREDGWAFAIVDGSPSVARVLEIAGLSEQFRRARLGSAPRA
jgi:anti-sigma B factor antagonist